MIRCVCIMLFTVCLMSGCIGHHLAMFGNHTQNQQPICPVCKTPLTITETTPSAVYKNQMYYFKDEEMKAIFLKEPGKYIIPTHPQDSGPSATTILLGILVGAGMLVMMGGGR